MSHDFRHARNSGIEKKCIVIEDQNALAGGIPRWWIRVNRQIQTRLAGARRHAVGPGGSREWAYSSNCQPSWLCYWRKIQDGWGARPGRTREESKLQDGNLVSETTLSIPITGRQLLVGLRQACGTLTGQVYLLMRPRRPHTDPPPTLLVARPTDQMAFGVRSTE